MTIPFFAPAKDSDWDKLILAGQTFPGVAVVEADQGRAVETKKRRRWDGVFLRDNGRDPSNIKAVLFVWTPEQSQELDRILPGFFPRQSGGLTSPTDISHPVTRILGIKQVYVKKISVSNPNQGILRVNFEMIEWFEKLRRVRFREAIKGDSKGGEVIDASDVDIPSDPSNVASNT